MVFEVIPFAVCTAGAAALGAGGWTLAGGKIDTCGGTQRMSLPAQSAPLVAAVIVPAERLPQAGRDGKGLSMKSQRSVEEIQSSLYGTDGTRNENKPYAKAHTGLSPRLTHVWETMAGTQDRREKPPPMRQEPVETRGPLGPSYDSRGKPDISLARGLTMAFRQVDSGYTPESAGRVSQLGTSPSQQAPRPQPPQASFYVPAPEFTPASRASPATIPGPQYSPANVPAPHYAATPPHFSREQPQQQQQQQQRPASQNKNAGVGISFVPTEQGKITIAHMVNGAPAAQSGELFVGDQARQSPYPLQVPLVPAVNNLHPATYTLNLILHPAP